MTKSSIIPTLILLMADAADGGAVDPLDMNVSDINTDYPIIPAKLYDLKITKAERKATKDSEGKQPGDLDYSENLVVSLATTEELKDQKGNVVAPGHTLSHYIGLTPRPERVEDGKTKRAYSNQDIATNIAKIAKAAGLSDTPRAIIQNPSVLEGKIVRTNVGISKATPQYPSRNEVKSFEVIK